MKYYYRLVDWVRDLLGLPTTYCEECEKPTEQYMTAYGAKFYICETCYEHIYCECGQRLEDSYGSPGDGFCITCR